MGADTGRAESAWCASLRTAVLHCQILTAAVGETASTCRLSARRVAAVGIFPLGLASGCRAALDIQILTAPVGVAARLCRLIAAAIAARGSFPLWFAAHIEACVGMQVLARAVRETAGLICCIPEIALATELNGPRCENDEEQGNDVGEP